MSIKAALEVLCLQCQLNLQNSSRLQKLNFGSSVVSALSDSESLHGFWQKKVSSMSRLTPDQRVVSLVGEPDQLKFLNV